MNKVLILTAGFGNGHHAAAFSLKDGFERVSKKSQVEVLDLFEICYEKTNERIKKLFLGVVQYTPSVWKGIYSVLDRTSLLQKQIGRLHKLQTVLHDILKSTRPGCIVSTHPVYSHAIDHLYKGDQERPFSLFTVITDSITINSVWYTSPSDYYLVPNQQTGEVLIQAGITSQKILNFGFPVSPIFYALSARQHNPGLDCNGTRRIIYIVNTSKKKATRLIEGLLSIPNIHLTVICGMDSKLKNNLTNDTVNVRNSVHILGWTNQMPTLLSSSHLVITKAGGAIVQEAMAAKCPILISSIIPGQEEGNASLIQQLGIGAVEMNQAQIPKLVHNLFENNGKIWMAWKKALSSHIRPDSSLQIAKFILQES